jgi:hypothetical protein
MRAGGGSGPQGRANASWAPNLKILRFNNKIARADVLF